MSKKKQEEKRRRYKDQDQRNQAHILNEREIEKCFSLFSGFWGIDRVVLDVKIIKVFKYKLLDQLSRSCKVVMSPYYDESTKDVYKNYNKIEIYDIKFGRLKLVHDDLDPFVKYATLELFHTGVNVETTNMAGIWARYFKAVECLKSKYGITLDFAPKVNLIELCFTYASDSIIPLPVRKYCVAALSGCTRLNARHYTFTSTNKDKHLITSGRKDSSEDITYDKTSKAEHLDQISKKTKHKIRVYRHEFVLKKSKLKTDKDLRSTLLANIPDDRDPYVIYLSDLTDENILAYVKMRVKKAIDYYRFSMISESLKYVKKLLKESRSIDPIHYSSLFDGKISTYQAEYDYSMIIDDESIVFAALEKVFSKTNISRSRRALLFSNTSSEEPRQQMYGWEVERILALMNQCIDNGLGCKRDDTADSPKCFVVAHGNYGGKEEYLSTLIGSPKRNKHVDYPELILDRISNKWLNDDFILQPLERLEEQKNKE